MSYTKGPWYTMTKESDRQGLICSEETGANVAVSYDPKDAAIIAAAPELLEALEAAKGCFTGHNLLSTATEAERLRTIENFLGWWNNVARLAVDKAKGE